MNQFVLAFLTGLTSGGVSCVAIQGGLLASSLTDSKTSNVKKILTFLNAKLAAYTILGAVLGLIGGSLVISPKVQGWLQILVGFYMLTTAARLLNLHPIFRYTVIQPPKFILKFMRRVSISDSFLTPIFLGLLTILIPCGVTQAMMILAVGARSAAIGSGIMFSFILGTFPIFFLFGIASQAMFKNKIMTIIAAIIIALIGILSINTGQVLRGDVHTFQNFLAILTRSDLVQGPTLIKDGIQSATIEVTSLGYKSNIKTLKAGIPVKLKIITKNEFGCGRSFVIPSLNYSKILPASGTTEVTFTPTQTGILTLTCSMGMYTGQFTIIN